MMQISPQNLVINFNDKLIHFRYAKSLKIYIKCYTNIVYKLHREKHIQCHANYNDKRSKFSNTCKQTNTGWSDVIISLSRYDFQERLEGLNFVLLAMSREFRLEKHFPLCCVAKRNTRRTPVHI